MRRRATLRDFVPVGISGPVGSSSEVSGFDFRTDSTTYENQAIVLSFVILPGLRWQSYTISTFGACFRWKRKPALANSGSQRTREVYPCGDNLDFCRNGQHGFNAQTVGIPITVANSWSWSGTYYFGLRIDGARESRTPERVAVQWILDLNPTQPQRVNDYRNRTEGHRCARDHRAQQDTEKRIEQAGGNRYAE